MAVSGPLRPRLRRRLRPPGSAAPGPTSLVHSSDDASQPSEAVWADTDPDMARIESRNGRWRARVWAPDGRERSRTFDRKSDAERWAVTQEADKHRGTWIDPTLGRETFASWSATWRTNLRRRPRTLRRYDTVVANHLLPRFGGTPLVRITRSDVQRMVADDIEHGYSASEVRRHVIVLRQILDAAVKDGRLGRNVAPTSTFPGNKRARCGS